MFEDLFIKPSTIERYRAAPLVEPRERYLRLSFPKTLSADLHDANLLSLDEVFERDRSSGTNRVIATPPRRNDPLFGNLLKSPTDWSAAATLFGPLLAERAPSMRWPPQTELPRYLARTMSPILRHRIGSFRNARRRAWPAAPRTRTGRTKIPCP